ncbi:MAG: signal peptidase I, partial [Lachnospiraceae bacterium]
VYIDGSEQPLQEDYVNGVPTGNYGPYVVPENSYFMLGDNRGNSEDSRFWTNKFVKKEKILAKAVVRYYPGIKLLTE